MTSDNPILIVEVPQWPTKIKVSERRKPTYYSEKNKIPAKYKHLGFKDGYLVDERGVWVVKNPEAVGTPRFVALAGNSFTTGLAYHDRKTVVAELKDFYRKFVRKLTPVPREMFPLRVEWDLYTTVDKANFDLSNLWFYYKYFEDTLFEKAHPKTGEKFTPIIPDDSIRYISQPGAPLLFPVENFEDRKFIFRFYPDNRQEIRDNPLWQHGRKPVAGGAE